MYVTGTDKCGQVQKYDCLGDSGTSVLKFGVAVFVISGYLYINVRRVTSQKSEDVMAVFLL
jgi:hypothetical protein